MFVPLPEHSLTHEVLMAQSPSSTAIDYCDPPYYKHYQLGKHLKQSGNPLGAQIEYQKAIHEVERSRNQLSIDQRSDFLVDKQSMYEEMVSLCIDLQQPAQALVYAEMLKSRTLHDILDMQINWGPHILNPSAQPGVAAFRYLRQARDQFLDAWQEFREKDVHSRMSIRLQSPIIQQALTDFEQHIATLWQSLMVQSTFAMHEPTSSSIPLEVIRDYLESDTALVEYFVINEKFVAFVVTNSQVFAYRLPSTVAQTQLLLRLLQLNLKAVMYSTSENLESLTRNATQLLQRLYELLFAPLQQMVKPYTRLIIVPHGLLHQLPFHALYDGTAYLIEQHAISYLPCATLLHYCKQMNSVKHTGNHTKVVSLGYSAGGQLPYALQEAQQVAKLMQGQVFLEESATKAHLYTIGADCRVLHLATHGNFRDDNPLFSGLVLADGWLTALDTFDLGLHASLITLSACQTGCHVVEDGDELRGLIWAFLATGTSTLVAGFWKVEDQSTAHLMDIFYRKLADGWTKSEALRYAQLYMLKGDGVRNQHTEKIYGHPYFWASFFLTGDAGIL